MSELVAFLDHWQTMIGAFLGGVFAIAAALLVAYKARRQEDLAAAMLVVGNLSSVRTSSRLLGELLENEELDKEKIPFWYATKLARRRPRLSPLFEASRIRLMPVDSHLAAHLELFQVIFSDVGLLLEKMEIDLAQYDSTDGIHRKPEVLRADARLIHRGFESAARHAECAERLLTLKVLSHYPTFHSVRMAVFRTENEKKCRRLLSSAKEDA